MGSFNFTCALSGLPITCGDEVKYYFLTENPYDDSGICSTHDVWFPRSLPVSAKYNDYGSIEDYDAKSPAVLSIIDCFTKDLVEKGTGDNCCHDVPTRKGMTFEETLTGVQKNRIQVLRQIERDLNFGDPPEAPKGIPTLRRITDLLQAAGHGINEGYYNNDGYLVDEKGQGWVRIRAGGFGEKAPLATLIPLLDEYAVILTAGTGNYSNRCELQVMPKPGEPSEHRGFLRKDNQSPCKIAQAMILKEVWDAICEENFEKQRKAVQKEWDSAVAASQGHKDSKKLLEELGEGTTEDLKLKDLLRRMVGQENPHSSCHSHVPFTMGLGEHFIAAADLHTENPFTDEQISVFLDDVAGFGCVQNVVHGLRYWWRPSYSCGPQIDEYYEHIEWHEDLYHISVALLKKNGCEEDEEDEEREGQEISEEGGI